MDFPPLVEGGKKKTRQRVPLTCPERERWGVGRDSVGEVPQGQKKRGKRLLLRLGGNRRDTKGNILQLCRRFRIPQRGGRRRTGQPVAK